MGCQSEDKDSRCKLKAFMLKKALLGRILDRLASICGFRRTQFRAFSSVGQQAVSLLHLASPLDCLTCSCPMQAGHGQIGHGVHGRSFWR